MPHARRVLSKSAFRNVLGGLILLVAVAPLSWAQISAGGTPPSFALSLGTVVPSVQMTPVDVQVLLTEDAQASKDEPYRFGANLDVSYNLSNSGAWISLPDGARLWRLRISSPGAFSINLLFDQFYMPPGAQLFLYNDDHSQVIGAFTDFNNFVTGRFGTQPVAGDAITLEYYEPAAVKGQGVISIYQVIHAYRNVFGHGALDNYGDSGTCNNNVNCPIGCNWQSDKRGVAVIISSGSRICTGSLINNVNQDQTPYFLTANHCLGGEATWVFMFNYEAPTCTNQDGPTNQTVANATLLAHTTASDFALLRLSSTVPLSYVPYFNGWNNDSTVIADSTTVIHHPNVDIKKISFDRNQPVSSTWSGTPANSHWRILAYESGTTEPGSSGSPLFDQGHRIIGQLHGGTASCSNNIDDYYGKFSRSWVGASSATRIRDWLDPSSTGVHTLTGFSPVSVTVSAPNGGENWTIGSVQNITWTFTNLSQNVKIELNRTYPTGAWETINASTSNSGTYAWTVTGAATTTARVRISGVTAISLNDVSNANFTISTSSTPSITVTAPNGGETWLVGDANNITWTSLNLAENVKIELNRSYPSVTWETITASTANTGSYSWTVSGLTTATARVRISGTVQTTVSDTSNANFTIGVRSLTVTAPNGGETWLTGDVNSITWTSSNLAENVKIELNRSYPGATWETIIASTPNTSSYAWAVTAPTSSASRVRISGVTHTAVGDTSNANFTIGTRTVAVTSPNGGEIWSIGTSQNLTWTSSNLTGAVTLDLNRTYPAGGWENIATGVANSGSYAWTVTGPASTTARVRLTSVSYPTVSDISDANFTIAAANQPPVIAHDPLHDQNTAPFVVTAIVTDDAPGFTVSFLYRAVGVIPFTSLAMTATGNPSEFAGTVGLLAEGQYEYYVQATDAGLLTTATAHYFFWVAAGCGGETAYDDGSAERSNWSQNTMTKWAVKFDAPSLPYVLCSVRIGISALHPDLTHSQIQVSVLNADGPGGLPGTPVATRVAGSIGNVIGGVPTGVDNWVTVFFRNNGQPFVLNGAFYIAVSNPDSAVGYEAFLSDSSSALAGRSYVYDPCDSSWHAEIVTDSVVHRGNRMIRVSGYGFIPPNDVVISPVGNDIHLDWTNVGSPYYHIYSSLVADGPFTLVGTSTTNAFIDVGVTDLRKFYRVYTSTTP